jgi:hypothetical protein
MQKLKLNTIVKIENNVLVATMNLYIGNHYLCTVTLHNANIVEITFPLILPKCCGGGMEMVSFTTELHLYSLNSSSLYQLYKESVDRYWKTSPYADVMRDYHLKKAAKYQKDKLSY